MGFEFATANRILFGAGVVQHAPAIAASLEQRALLVAGSRPDRAESLLSALHNRGLNLAIFSITGEPTVADALAGVRTARLGSCDLVIGFGGGSVLDTAKAIAALLANGGDPLDYLEVIGGGQPVRRVGAGQRGLGRGTRLRRAYWRHVPCAAWRDLRPPPAAADGRQRASPCAGAHPPRPCWPATTRWPGS